MRVRSPPHIDPVRFFQVPGQVRRCRRNSRHVAQISDHLGVFVAHPEDWEIGCPELPGHLDLPPQGGAILQVSGHLFPPPGGGIREEMGLIHRVLALYRIVRQRPRGISEPRIRLRKHVHLGAGLDPQVRFLVSSLQELFHPVADLSAEAVPARFRGGVAFGLQGRGVGPGVDVRWQSGLKVLVVLGTKEVRPVDRTVLVLSCVIGFVTHIHLGRIVHMQVGSRGVFARIAGGAQLFALEHSFSV